MSGVGPGRIMVKDDWLSERGTVWEIAGRCEISGLEENRDLAEVNCVIFSRQSYQTELSIKVCTNES